MTAIDVVDVVTILDFGGDRTRALRELAERFGFNKAAERKALAKLIFDLARRSASQEAIEAFSFAEGQSLGLSRAEVIEVATWCAAQIHDREAA